jgi:hypothetical protein
MEIGALCKSAVVVARRHNEAISRVALSQFFALVFLRHRGISRLQQRSAPYKAHAGVNSDSC